MNPFLRAGNPECPRLAARKLRLRRFALAQLGNERDSGVGDPNESQLGREGVGV
jgi:hypothetical protein